MPDLFFDGVETYWANLMFSRPRISFESNLKLYTFELWKDYGILGSVND
jgi:hypothetical protein